MLETTDSTTSCAHAVVSFTNGRGGGTGWETMTPDPGGTEQGWVRFYHATRNIVHLKIYELFLEFSISYVWTAVDLG